MTTVSAVIYCRISDDREGAGLGVERQEVYCREKAAAMGWDVIDVFTDNDISAYKGKRRLPRRRPGYEKLLEGLEAGRYDGLIVYHADRLHRYTKELERFIDVVEHSRTKIAAVRSGDLDLSTPSGRAMAKTQGAWAQAESETKAERIIDKHRQLREAGKPSGGGTRAWGYELDGMHIRQSEATTIQAVATRLIAGESIGSVVRWLNTEGHTTSTGGSWRTTTFKRTITSARLCAWRELDGQFVAQGVWPAILTRSQTEQLRAALNNPARSHSGPPRKYLLSGMLRCEHCGKPMLGAPRDDGSRRYRCVPPPAGKGCGRMFALAEPVEAEIEAQFFALLSENDFSGLVQRSTDAPELVAVIQADEVKLSELGQDYDDGHLTRAEYVARRARLTERLEANRAALAAGTSAVALTDLLRPGSDLGAAWAALSLERKRAALLAVVDHVTVSPGVRGRNKFDPNRLHVTWAV